MTVLLPSHVAEADGEPNRDHVEAGFTLIELLVVLVILGLLAAIATPATLGYLNRARTSTASIQIKNLETVLDLYNLELGSYPTTEQGVKALVAAPPGVTGWAGPYVKHSDMIIDPWGHPYRYKFPGEHGAYDLYTLGADDSPGGSSQNADVASWQP